MSNHFQFNEFFRSLERVGFMDVLLPFLLIFTIIFAILDKTKILGEGKRNMNIGIALIFALIVVIPHTTGNLPAGYDPVLIINKALPSVSLVIIAVISLMILLGVFAHDRLLFGASAPGWVAIFSFVSILIIFGSAAGWWVPDLSNWLNNVFGADALAVFIMLLVFGVIIAFVTGGGGDREKIGAMEHIKRLVPDFFGKK